MDINDSDSAQNPSAGNTTRDQRLRVQTLREAGFTYEQIYKQLGLTLRQVQYAVNNPVIPKKRKGRPSILTSDEVELIITWVCQSKAHRRAPWAKIPTYLELDVSFYAVRNAL
jgi:sulfur carrier protein ThiS